MGILSKSFENSVENHEFVKKKNHAHSFASNNSIFNQNKPTHTLLKLIRYENWKPNRLDVGFFLTNYLRLIFYFSKKEKNNILKHFFYEKIVPILFFFYKKSKLTKKISIFK